MKIRLSHGQMTATEDGIIVAVAETRQALVAQLLAMGYHVPRGEVFRGLVCVCGRCPRGFLCPHCGARERIRADLFQLERI